ncbi:hypothetical protein, partial [Vibrio gazogenes]|uniref:hypothetical protein n=1 Tax=Vibrio gazogenes TaxID=687 RepID=UPI0019672370
GGTVDKSIKIQDDKLVVSDQGNIVAELKVLDGMDPLPFLVEDVSSNVITLIKQVTAHDFPEGLTLYTTDCHGDPRFSWVDLSRELKSDKLLIDVTLSIDFIDWAKPFTITQFSERYAQEVAVNGYVGLAGDEDLGSMYIHIIKEVEGNDLIGDLINQTIEHAANIYEQTEFKLNRNVQDQVLIKIFNFPPNYQFVCAQYLVWFGELLSEIGINANIHSEQNGSQTKLIVAPENAPEMLSEVERLFHLYLALPYSEFLPAHTSTPYERMVVSNLQAQINSFKSQVQLKDSIIELKNETINSLQNKVEKQSERLMLLDCLDEKISLFDGAIKIGNIEWGAISINPKLLLDKIK